MAKKPTKTTIRTPAKPDASPGRPAGSTNRDYSQSVKIIPAHCPRPSCQSTDVEILARFKTEPYGGTTPDGFVFTRIVRRRMRCRACGQYFAAMFYENQPKPENNSPNE